MIAGIDIIFAIYSIYNLIFKQLGLDKIPIIIYIDFFSFYEYLVKLGIITEKRFMIDIIALR
jgi:hypothetical protein